MRAVSFDEGTLKELNRVDGRTRVRQYIGGLREISDSPTALLVNVPDPGSVITPHFHDVDEFQVTVDGDGTLGKNKLAPITFQFVNSYTPYGPIVAGKNGLTYFTLRITSAGGHFLMPENQDKVKGKKKRNIVGNVPSSTGPLEAGKVARFELVDSESDGLSVINMRLGAHARQAGAVTPSAGGGQFWLILDGSAVHNGKTLPKLSVIHVAANDPPPTVEAGADGAEILVVQFPAPSDRPGSDPSKLERPTEYVGSALKT